MRTRAPEEDGHVGGAPTHLRMMCLRSRGQWRMCLRGVGSCHLRGKDKMKEAGHEKIYTMRLHLLSCYWNLSSVGLGNAGSL